jgi:hypothetical protein
MMVSRENQRNLRKLCSSATLLTTDLTCSHPGLNLRLHSKKPGCNSPSMTQLCSIYSVRYLHLQYTVVLSASNSGVKFQTVYTYVQLAVFVSYLFRRLYN